MQIKVNGDDQAVNEPCTVRSLLELHGLGDAVCAVEVNRAIVPRAHHTTHELGDGDQVEIVTLVGGG